MSTIYINIYIYINSKTTIYHHNTHTQGMKLKMAFI